MLLDSSSPPSDPSASSDGGLAGWARRLRRAKRLGLTALVLPIVVGGAAAYFVDFQLSGFPEGFYLLRGVRKPLEISSDLYLGEEGRVLVAVPFEPVWSRLRALTRPASVPPFLRLEWEEGNGEGFVFQELPGGKRLLTCFSRFLDDHGQVPLGLFVGGGLPYGFDERPSLTRNETGMAYFDGIRWFHLWCNVNEIVTAAAAPDRHIHPSEWEYLGSKVVEDTPAEVVLEDAHRVSFDGVPVRIEKRAVFRAGETFFTLATRFVNEGRAPAHYFYVYGDEPWVGDYGTSAGGVGWTRTGLVKYEGPVDVTATEFMGIYDYGNDAAGEPHAFTGSSNFLEWRLDNPPDLAYFSNGETPVRRLEDRVPLASRQSRSLSVQWGPRELAPGGSESYVLAIGMAYTDPSSPGMPTKPAVSFDRR